VQALVGELLQGIIHKPMLGHAAQALKNPSPDAHPKMCAMTRPIRARMTGMVGAFIKHLQGKGL
jgi:hypothetical protein